MSKQAGRSKARRRAERGPKRETTSVVTMDDSTAPEDLYKKKSPTSAEVSLCPSGRPTSTSIPWMTAPITARPNVILAKEATTLP
mmetsp:Transcript_99304/g.157084  ORF Transcript_99304/g.157084 Transcript_99304/m.157084 type:complete len:85 (+) Transcript_99304:536-790(+)